MSLDALRGLRQPDQRSCGPSSLVAAHMVVDPAFAATQDVDAFAASVLELHRSLTSPRFGGRTQLPWPRALGTPPWAAARAMSAYTGVRYRTRVSRTWDPGSLPARLAPLVGAALPVPLYIGSRWLPRHVVLAVADADGGVRVYDPARGSVSTRVFGRWGTPWFAVVPHQD